VGSGNQFLHTAAKLANAGIARPRINRIREFVSYLSALFAAEWLKNTSEKPAASARQYPIYPKGY